MHVEFRNNSSGKRYYLCYNEGDYAAVIFNHDIRNHLADIPSETNVKMLFDQIRPIVDRLDDLDPGVWIINVFRFTEHPVRSLTETQTTTSYGMWRVGEPCYINGVRQSTKFISL